MAELTQEQEEIVERMSNALADIYICSLIQALREVGYGAGERTEKEKATQSSSSEDDENIIDLDESLSQFNRKNANRFGWGGCDRLSHMKIG